jgi:ubiquinone/menaquinone biosynthesis C-methylase UbiE
VLSYERDIFPHVTALLMNNPVVNARRKRVLSDVSGRTLEVGFGSGLNLPFYGPGLSQLVALDPSASAWRLARRRLRRSALPVQFVEAPVEEMAFEDGAFDSVVLTWTLCSVRDPPQALKQIRRVLRPGGRLHFLEHGLSDNASVRRSQHIWAPVQRALCAGCRLTLRVDEEIARAGFSLAHLQTGHVGVPRTLSYVYQGVAIKDLV